MGTEPSGISVRYTASNLISVTHDGAAITTQKIKQFADEKGLRVIPLVVPENADVTRVALYSDRNFSPRVVGELTKRLNPPRATIVRRPQAEVHAGIAL
jgi:hypothetical protein